MKWRAPDGGDLFFTTHKDVYRPAEDTFLLAHAVHAELATRPRGRFLEVGCGAAIVALVAARLGWDTTCTDANPEAIRLASHNAHENRLTVHAAETDLLQGLAGPFDVVAFNPPYLPTLPEERLPGAINLAFDGGTSGNDVVLRFVEQVAALSPRPSCVLVVHSSLSDPAHLQAAMARLGYRHDVAVEQKLDFERLTVQRFQLGP